MPDRMRWRYGDTNYLAAAVDADSEIRIGDLVYQEWSHDREGEKSAYSAADWPGDLAEHEPRQTFAARFLGVAMQRSRRGDTDPIRVATTGVFEFDAPRGWYELGGLLGPAGAQGVQPVSTADEAIGRVAKRGPAGQHGVLVDVRSTVMTGGVAGTTADRGGLDPAMVEAAKQLGEE